MRPFSGIGFHVPFLICCVATPTHESVIGSHRRADQQSRTCIQSIAHHRRFSRVRASRSSRLTAIESNPSRYSPWKNASAILVVQRSRITAGLTRRRDFNQSRHVGTDESSCETSRFVGTRVQTIRWGGVREITCQRADESDSPHLPPKQAGPPASGVPWYSR